MNRYQIESRAGVIFGVYEGEARRDAFLAMLAEAGGEYGAPHVGTEADWIITQAD